MSEISELKKTCEEKKGVPTSADTRLITPHDLSFAQIRVTKIRSEEKKVSTLTDWRNCEKMSVSSDKK